MKFYKITLHVLIVLMVNQLSSQDLQLTAKDSIIKRSWIVGLGFNAVDDSGDAFNDFTTIKDQWNAVPFPSRLSIGRYFKSGIGLEAIATYNRYKEGNIVDNAINMEDKDYFGLDARLSYDLNKIIGETGWFDPYIGAGLGYTDANDIGRGTYNAVVGFRTWFSDRWGLDFNSSGKWAFGNDVTNHIQHAAGVVYQFETEKGLTKKGQEKLALIEALEKENQRVADSTALAKKAEEEAKALAEQLAREKERKEAEEQARLAAQKRIQDIENQVKALGYVYFDLNSSYLSKEYKGLLDQLYAIMQENPTLIIKVTSHTDARGTDKYNVWLSERRVKQTMDYLFTKGITEDKLQGEAFGEEKLTNECKDGVYCSEEKHRKNRRSEFIVVKV
ncbi:OmpA family protein [Spongiimicrobium sp. 3-5]|uniref:OmpA family protein n=1 Tax=Spongiimicrobium sp. 3-5 TaxID=3332596 RepID=UPI00398170A2